MTDEKWQINKSVSVWHMIGTFMLLIGGFTFIYDLKNAIAIQQFQLETVEDRLERVVQRTDNQFEDIISSLQRLEEKLDGIVLSSKPVQQKGD